MKITATRNQSTATFTWNQDLTECNHVAMNVTDKDFDSLINNKVHEGSDLKGWEVRIDL